MKQLFGIDKEKLDKILGISSMPTEVDSKDFITTLYNSMKPIESEKTHNHPGYNGYMNDCPKCCESEKKEVCLSCYNSALNAASTGFPYFPCSKHIPKFSEKKEECEHNWEPHAYFTNFKWMKCSKCETIKQFDWEEEHPRDLANDIVNEVVKKEGSCSVCGMRHSGKCNWLDRCTKCNGSGGTYRTCKHCKGTGHEKEPRKEDFYGASVADMDIKRQEHDNIRMNKEVLDFDETAEEVVTHEFKISSKEATELQANLSIAVEVLERITNTNFIGDDNEADAFEIKEIASTALEKLKGDKI